VGCVDKEIADGYLGIAVRSGMRSAGSLASCREEGKRLEVVRRRSAPGRRFSAGKGRTKVSDGAVGRGEKEKSRGKRGEAPLHQN
jgi:hypothetical protein